MATLKKKPINVPIAVIDVKCKYVNGKVKAGVVDKLAYDMMLGNKYLTLSTPSRPLNTENTPNPTPNSPNILKVSKSDIRTVQSEDKSLENCFDQVNKTNRKLFPYDYIIRDGILYRFNQHSKFQLVVPHKYRTRLIHHFTKMKSDNCFDANIIATRILTHYFWNTAIRDIYAYANKLEQSSKSNHRSRYNLERQKLLRKQNNFNYTYNVGDKVDLLIPANNNELLNVHWSGPHQVKRKIHLPFIV